MSASHALAPDAQGHPPHRLPEIDVLRGIVIIMVFTTSYGARYQSALGHTHDVSWVPNLGFLALQLFLALSGYRLLLDIEAARNPGEYLQARLLRYLPALWPAVALAAFIPWITHLAPLRVAAASIPANLLMAADLVGVPVVDPSFWRLKIELLVSVGVGLLWFTFGRRISPWAILGGLAIEAALAHGTDPVHRHTISITGFLTFDEYLPPTAFGIALCHLIQAPKARGWWCVAAAALCLVPLINTPAHAAIVLSAMAVFALASTGWLGFLASWRGLIWIGQISYPIYLVHQIPGFALISQLEAVGLHPVLAMLVTSAAATGCGAALHHAFERPARTSLPIIFARAGTMLTVRPALAPAGLDNQLV